MLTWEQQEQNWINLDPSIKQYFNVLAESDPDRTGQAFFEDTVPENIQSYPEAVTDILNGNDALNIADKDWSHDISDHNGGSGAVENGTFEDLSLNRARQEVNMTGDELEIADTQLQVDADILETVYETVEAPADLISEALGTTGQLLGNAMPPIILAMKAGRAISDDPQEQVQVACGVGTMATVGMFTPAAPFIAAGASLCAIWSLTNWCWKRFV